MLTTTRPPVRSLLVHASYLLLEGNWHWQPRWVNKQELPAWKTGPTLFAFVAARRTEGWVLMWTYQSPDVEGVPLLRLFFLCPLN